MRFYSDHHCNESYSQKCAAVDDSIENPRLRVFGFPGLAWINHLLRYSGECIFKFGKSLGYPQKVAIIHIDCRSCNSLDDSQFFCDSILYFEDLGVATTLVELVLLLEVHYFLCLRSSLALTTALFVLFRHRHGLFMEVLTRYAIVSLHLFLKLFQLSLQGTLHIALRSACLGQYLCKS